MNKTLENIKLGLAALLGSATALLGALAAPVYLLVGMNLLDYATGLTAAPYRGQQRSSYRGLRGIAKKVCMWLLVAVGASVDWLLLYAAQNLGMTTPLRCLVACCVAMWLICNEILSILENISDIGVELPPFLRPLVQWVRQQADGRGKAEQHEDC